MAKVRQRNAIASDDKPTRQKVLHVNEPTHHIAAGGWTARRNAPEQSIGKMLLDAGKLSPEDAERVLRVQKERNMLFGEAAVELGLITPADIEQVLSRQFHYPCLQPGEGKFSPELNAAYHPRGAQVEVMRRLRSQLMLRWLNSEHKSLAIISPETGEGRSYIAANLAVVFSQLGERTLLIDADLRSPRQHRIFNLPGRQGLSDVLGGRADLGAIERIPAFLDLSVLPAGTLAPNPGELLNRATIADLLQHASENYDVILIDTSPAMPYADALTVAAHAGGALMVMRKDHTRITQAALLRDLITDAGAALVGTVLSQF